MGQGFIAGIGEPIRPRAAIFEGLKEQKKVLRRGGELEKNPMRGRGSARRSGL
jgi:hypothetical protein